MESAARYAEHPLHPGLAGMVQAAWSVRLDGGAPEVAHRVLPDGCIDVVVRPGAAPFVVGPTTAVVLEPLRPGDVVHGLRFRPGAAPFALGVGADDLRDRTVPLADVLGRPAARAGRRAAGALAGDRPHSSADPAVPVGLVELQLLVAACVARPTDPLVDAAVARLTRAPGTDIRALAAEVALSERQLRRRFQVAVGYGPKRLARVLRLQRLLSEARRSPGALGVQLALAAGYADEAHMGREARELAGTAAQALLAERGRSVAAP